MPSRDINDCTDELQSVWSTVLMKWDHPVKPFLTCTHRTNEEQAELYAIGRTVPGKKVTNAPAGKSLHNLKPSQAFDVAFKNPGGSLNWDVFLFKKLADLIKTINPNITWGGDFRTFKDRPHYELNKP